MKLRRLLFSTTLFLGALGAVAQAGEPQWVFNHGDDLSRFSVGQGLGLEEFGLVTIDSTGTDCTLGIRLGEDERFEAEEYPFFAMRYKFDSKFGAAALFYAAGDVVALSDNSYTEFPLVSDDTWRQVVVDMRKAKRGEWKGLVNQVRLDPTNPSDSDSTYSISRMGFFATEDAAAEFLAEADDRPDYARPTVVTEDAFRCYIPGGAVDKSFDRSAFMLKNPAKPDKFKLNGSREELVVVNGSRVEALCDVSSRGFATYCVREGGDLRLKNKALDAKSIDFKGRDSEAAIRFVVARELMSADGGKFRPEDKLTKEEIAALAKALKRYESYGEVGKNVAALANELNGSTREAAAKLIESTIREGLNTKVDGDYSREYYTRDRIRVGSWANFRALDLDDEYMKTYADCGFDFMLPFIGRDTVDILKLANKYGVEVYVNDDAYRRPLVGDAEYCDYPNYTGSYVTDEPGSESYDKLAAVCNPYHKATGLQAYVNLLPMYANAAQLKYGAGAAAIEYYDADPDLFKKYCEAFCQKFDTNYICTDIYPFNWDGRHKKNTYADYVESINIIASVAREYDREFWCYIQTFAWIESKRTPNEPEFRWQCYSMLSFGCKCLLCWTYAGYEDEFPSLVDTKSRKTPAWYAAKPVMWEMRAISDEYVKFRNLGAFTHNCSDDTPYLKMTNEYKDFATIEKIECEKPLLIGCFEGKENAAEKAFTLVNMAEFEEVAGATVRVKLDGETVTSWRRGKPVVVAPDEDGFYTFELESGDGVFVTVR